MPPQKDLRVVDPARNDEYDNLREPLLSTTEPPTNDDEEQQRLLKARQNVHAALWYAAVAFTGSSIWGNNVLATYVYMLADHRPAAVGYLTGVMGVCNLLCSMPAGYVADTLWRRDTVLRAASAVRTVAIGITLYAIALGLSSSSNHNHPHPHYSTTTTTYAWLMAGLALWGSSRGMANTALGALFADSIQRGQRSHYFTQRTMVRTVGNMAGPVVSLILFAVLGDHWTLHDCSAVLVAGQVISIGTLIILCWFDDDGALPDPDQPCPTTATATSHAFSDRQNIDLEQENLLPTQSMDESIDVEHDNDSYQEQNLPLSSSRTATQCCGNIRWLWTNRRIPVLVCLSDMMLGLASGMSIKYFPIFFLTNLQLGPVVVQVLYILSPLLQTILTKVSQQLSLRYGRCHVSAAFRWVGVFFMISLVLTYHYGGSVAAVCVLYVLRTGFVNSTRALTRSLLMDHVPTAERGRWSAMESVNTLSWSGSAVLGGILVGAVGLLPLFVVTACLQFAATLPLVVLFSQDKTEGAVDEEEEDVGHVQENLDVDNESGSQNTPSPHRHID